jgi:hypothetical protein
MEEDSSYEREGGVLLGGPWGPPRHEGMLPHLQCDPLARARPLSDSNSLIPTL